MSLKNFPKADLLNMYILRIIEVQEVLERALLYWAHREGQIDLFVHDMKLIVCKEEKKPS